MRLCRSPDLDTGIISGQDTIAALAHGAHFTFIGRAYLYGLMAGGRQGVDRTIEILRAQMERTMTLLGGTTRDELEPGHVTRPKCAEWWSVLEFCGKDTGKWSCCSHSLSPTGCVCYFVWSTSIAKDVNAEHIHVAAGAREKSPHAPDNFGVRALANTASFVE